jgi:signal transduction histidine kinase
MKSLQQRLGVALLISLTATFTALWWLTDGTLQDIAEKHVASRLAQEAENVLAATRIDKTKKVRLDKERINPAYQQPFSGQYYQLYSDNEIMRSRSLWDMDLAIPNLAAGEKRRLYLSGPQQQSLLVMAYGYDRHDRTIVVAVAEDLSPTLAFIEPFQLRFLIITVTILLLLIVMQILIIGTAFQPLKSIQRQLSALKQGTVTRLDTEVPKEVSALVDEINWLLQALEQRVQRPHNAIDDLAQALKPALGGLPQLPDEESLQTDPEISQPLTAETASSGCSLETSFLEDPEPSLMKPDIEQEILTLINVLQSMYRDKNLDIIFTMPRTDVLLIDSEDMLELSSSLLKNACKWAQSRVKLSLEIDEAIYLRIEDDGPGISDTDMLEHNTQANKRPHQGLGDYGIGLSTAQSIAKHHGGELKFHRSRDLGGFCVEVVLPLTEPL